MNPQSNIPSITSGGAHQHGIADITGLRAELDSVGTGSGVPDGGTTGQVLTKASNTDGDAGWETPTTGFSVFVDITDVTLTAPAEGDLLVLGPGGSGVVNTPNALTTLNDNEFLVGVTGDDPVAKTVAQVQALLGIDKFAIAYTDSAPVDGTIVVVVRAPFAGTVNSATFDLDSGTVTVAAKINGTNITGLSAVSVTSTKATTNGTAANTVAVGDEISFTFSSASTPVNFRATLNFTRG